MIVWYGLWAALFTSLVGFLASWWWLTQEPSPEPTAALYASAAVFIVSVIGLPIKVLFFVLIDGWSLLVSGLVRSYGA